MSFWCKKEVDFQQMAELLQQNPGLTASELAQFWGVAVSTITRRLPSRNDAGILLSEDDKERLYLFNPEK